jgi:hypothetical protein
MNFYVSLFGGSEITEIVRYGPGQPGPEGSLMKAAFTVGGQSVLCTDSLVKHGFGFTPSIRPCLQTSGMAALSFSASSLEPVPHGIKRITPLTARTYIPYPPRVACFGFTISAESARVLSLHIPDPPQAAHVPAVPETSKVQNKPNPKNGHRPAANRAGSNNSPPPPGPARNSNCRTNPTKRYQIGITELRQESPQPPADSAAGSDHATACSARENRGLQKEPNPKNGHQHSNPLTPESWSWPPRESPANSTPGSDRVAAKQPRPQPPSLRSWS